MNIKLVALAAALGISTPALAQSSAGEPGGLLVGVTGGTLGVGPEVAYRMSPAFGVRGNLTFLGVSRDFESDDVDYDGKLKLKSGGLMIDVHPFNSGFRLSAGARISGNKVRLRATPNEDVEIGDEVFTPAEVGVLTGTAKANKFAPTLTAGWGGGLTPGVKFGIEAGAMLQGSPKIRNLRATGLLASDPDFQAQLRQETEELEDDVDYKVYPILQISLAYRF